MKKRPELSVSLLCMWFPKRLPPIFQNGDFSLILKIFSGYCVLRIILGVWATAGLGCSASLYLEKDPTGWFARIFYGFFTILVFTLIFMRYLRVTVAGSWKAIRYILLVHCFALAVLGVFLLELSIPKSPIVEMDKQGSGNEAILFFADSAISMFWYLFYTLSRGIQSYYNVNPQKDF